MAQSNPLVPWTDEQWARVNQVIQEEAHRARIAATFLPLYGPLPANADFVRTESVFYNPLRIADKNTTQLATLQLSVRVRGEQLADPEMGSVSSVARRTSSLGSRMPWFSTDLSDTTRTIPEMRGIRLCPTTLPTPVSKSGAARQRAFCLSPTQRAPQH
jgi:hypothetical protein